MTREQAFFYVKIQREVNSAMEEGSHQAMTVLKPWTLISSLYNCEEQAQSFTYAPISCELSKMQMYVHLSNHVSRFTCLAYIVIANIIFKWLCFCVQYVYSMYRIQLYTIFISSVCFLCVIYEKSIINILSKVLHSQLY